MPAPVTPPGFHIAADRAVLRVAGDDRVSFLQGIISANAAAVTETHGVWAAFLTPQGKYLHDFFLVADGDTILMDGEAGRIDDLHRRLRRYTLRSAVTVQPDAALSVALTTGPAPPASPDLRLFGDRRHPEAGSRWIGAEKALRSAAATAGVPEQDRSQWDRNRIRLGLPDGSRDFEIERSTLAEGNADLLGAVDWQKGCWMGQEVTARMHYRGLAKRRLVPMRVDGPMPEYGTPVTRDGDAIGECRSSAGDLVLVLAKVAAVASDTGPVQAGDAALTPVPPAWLREALQAPAPASEAG